MSNEWLKTKLGDPDFTKMSSGTTPRRENKDYFQGQHVWIKSGELNDYEIHDSEEHISDTALIDGGLRIYPPGTVLVAMYGATAGKTGLLQTDGAVNQAICAIQANRERLDPRFLQYQLQYKRPTVLNERHGGAQPNINRAILGELDIDIPDVSEQRHIAHVLAAIQAVEQAQNRTLKALSEFKEAALDELFTHGLHGEPQQETEAGPAPASWVVTNLGSLCADTESRIQTGPFGSQLHAHEYQTHGIPVVNPTHLGGNRINHEAVPKISEERAESLARHRLAVGDILFARRGEIGRLGLVGNNEAGWICGTGCFLVRVRHREIFNPFLARLFSCSNIVRWLEANAAGAIMPNLNNTVLTRLPVCYPSIREQQEIVAIIDATDRKIELHRRKRSLLVELFETLLHKLMTGEMRVADLQLGGSENQTTKSLRQGAVA